MTTWRERAATGLLICKLFLNAQDQVILLFLYNSEYEDEALDDNVQIAPLLSPGALNPSIIPTPSLTAESSGVSTPIRLRTPADEEG